MKTKAQVIKEYPDYKRLINAVVYRLGRDNIQNVNEHGIDGGYHGFTYTADTVRFWELHKAQIVGLLNDMADDFGKSKIKLIQGFHCLKDDGFSEDEIGAVLYGPPARVDRHLYFTVANALAWFAAEEVCRMFED